MLCDSPDLVRRGFTSAERLGGSLAEYMLIWDRVICRIPESVNAEDAPLYNPLSAGFEWAVGWGGVRMGDDMLILGAGHRGMGVRGRLGRSRSEPDHRVGIIRRRGKN